MNTLDIFYSYHIFAYLSLIGCLANLLMGLLVLATNPRDSKNRLYFLTVNALAIWGFGEFMMRLVSTADEAHFWFKVSAIGWLSVASFYLHFMLIFAGKKKLLQRPFIYTLLYTPPITFIYLMWHTNYFKYTIVRQFWGFTDVPGDIFIAVFIYMQLFFISSIYLCWRKWIFSRHISERKQARFVTLGFLVPWLAGSMSDGLFPYLRLPAVEMAVVLSAFNASIVAYAMFRFRLMGITPAIAAENIIDTMADMLVVIGNDRKIKRINYACCDLLGYTPVEVVGKTLGIIVDISGEEADIEDIVLRRNVSNRRMNFISKNGELIPVNFSSSLVMDSDLHVVGCVGVARDMRKIEKLIHELEEAKEHLEEKVRDKTHELGSKKEELEKANKELVKGRDAMLNILEDFKNANTLLEEKSRHLEKAYQAIRATQAQLMQADKMAAVGQLAAGVAHEINNPMGFILSNLQSLEGYITTLTGMLGHYERLLSVVDDSTRDEIERCREEIIAYAQQIKLDFLLKDIPALLQETQEGAQRVLKIVRDLRTFSRADDARREYADINIGLESTLNIVWNELKYKAQVMKDYGVLPQILCYPQQLNQVFMNLLVNAAQAIEDKGKIEIKTYEADGNVCVDVSDTGGGIPKKMLLKIFDPFFTTKPVGQGTGLGLSIAYNIIKKHNGHIDVQSTEGEGTRFHIAIPIDQPIKEPVTDEEF